MYAILQQSGHQYRVSPGDRLLVDRLSAEVGSVVALEPVVLVQGDAGSPTVGTPVVDGVRVAATVVSHPKGGKIRVFKYKAKKRYRRTHGHRSLMTELRVEAVLAAGEALPEPKVAEVAPAKPARTRSKAKAAAPEAPEVATAPDVPSAEVAAAPEVPSAVVPAAPEASSAEVPTAPEDSSEISSSTTKARPRSRAKAPTDDAPEAPAGDAEPPKRRPRAKKPEA